jgi:hypothetical protein
MFWPFKRELRPPEKWYAPRIRFVGEQDGPPERQLKAELNALLAQRSHVQRAYLARAVYDDPQLINIVLAIHSTSQNAVVSSSSSENPFRATPGYDSLTKTGSDLGGKPTPTS